ncbi:hypothetical protein MPDQ_007312 [Monascus purpureus]|uniref:SnoaL-like domain-containing protein n=1 Tax=Monascus purpureus TaxID=5098 RepID=A0A507QWJ2_MONPU|nr:hypothetical protein MPDQ_007312 [Monascus purpureus]BDD62600.1 hypothetical protein MAP00_007565 [Monascus purpureus]
MLAEDEHSLQYPDNVQIHEDIKGLIGRYYAAFDTCGGQDECAQCFAEDAVITAPNGVQIHGREAVRSLHQKSWASLSRRLHRPTKMFPFGNQSTEFVIIGTAEVWEKEGKYSKMNSASHFRCRRDAASGVMEIISLNIWVS